MLLNLSNHPSELWSAEQLNTAKEKYGNVKDIRFPAVDPYADEEDIQDLANEYVEMCKDILSKHKIESNAVHVMGEFSFCFAVVSGLQKSGITCIASTSTRISEELSLNEKISKFQFVKFREYKI